jgi:hypothetical protein
MFRIMRGPDQNNDVEKDQLDELKEIARNTRGLDFGLDLDVVDLPAAAGA